MIHKNSAQVIRIDLAILPDSKSKYHAQVANKLNPTDQFHYLLGADCASELAVVR